MNFTKGNKIGTGRPKGAKNKRTLMIEVIAERFQQDPFEILMKFALGDWKGLGYDNETYVMENAQGATKIGYTISPEMRLSATKECCQYLYPKMKQLEIPEEEEIDVSTPEQKRELLEKAEIELKRLKEELDLINE